MLLIPRPIAKAISKRLLDWAEPLPPFKGTIIRQLQHDRAQQRKDADEWQIRSVQPVGVNLTYLKFRLIEVCSAERIAAIREAVEELAPPIFPHDDEGDFITSPTFTAGAWKSLGMLRPRDPARKTSPSPGWGALPLPDQVERVHLSVHKVLPTTFLLAADVYLTDKAQKQLQNIQSEKYLPIKVFTGIQRVPYLFLPGTTTSAPVEQQKAYRGWMDKCRSETQRALQAQFPSMFLNSDGHRDAPMPAIDVFSLEGPPADNAGLSNWLNDNRMFMASVGDQTLGFRGYKSDDVIISMPYSSTGQVTVWRLYLLNDAKVLRRNTESTREACDEIHTWLALLDSARRTDRVIHELQSLSARSQQSWGMRKHFKLYRELVITSMQLSRLSLDIAEWSVWLRSNYLATFKQITVPGDKPASDIAADLPRFAKRYLESVANYAKSELEGVKDEVAWRNMRWIYWLQIAVLLISGIAAVFGYLAVSRIPAAAPPVSAPLRVR